MSKTQNFHFLLIILSFLIKTYAAPQSVDNKDVICLDEYVQLPTCWQGDALSLIDYLRFDAPDRDVEKTLTTDTTSVGPDIYRLPYNIMRPGGIGTCRIQLKFVVPSSTPRPWEDRFTLNEVGSKARYIFHRCPWYVGSVAGLGRGGKTLGGEMGIIGIKLIPAHGQEDVGDISLFNGSSATW